MKKLLILLTLIPLVSCDSTETSNTNKFKYPLDDVWIFYKFGYDTDSEEELMEDARRMSGTIPEKNLEDVPYILINNMEIERGNFQYNSYLKKAVRIPYDLDYPSRFKNNNRDSLVDNYLDVDGGEFLQIFSIKVSRDTLVLETKNIFSGDTVFRTINEKQFYLRKSMYSSTEARAILINKKTDLDLEVITKKQYDSIKNKLSRYITD